MLSYAYVCGCVSQGEVQIKFNRRETLTQINESAKKGGCIGNIVNNILKTMHDVTWVLVLTG